MDTMFSWLISLMIWISSLRNSFSLKFRLFLTIYLAAMASPVCLLVHLNTFENLPCPNSSPLKYFSSKFKN
jgi:hypothetical protein